jgi:LysR family glycine cleavage system transcriptional activator
MARRLPPLKALRAFDSAARLLSFTRAADDLAVTQTAISHQIRALEEWFGTPLFHRGGRKLTLSEPGRLLYPAVSEAFDRIAEAAERVGGAHERLTLTISVTPTFGSRWLAARLGRFWRAYPDIDLRLHYSVQRVDFVRDGVDAAVRWGRGTWDGVDAQPLMGAWAVPLCSPALIDGTSPLRKPADLVHHTLLHETDYQEWTEWLAAAGVYQVDGHRGPVINDPNIVAQAAVEGRGVLMGVPSMLAEEIEAGRLVAPFGMCPDPEVAYYFVCAKGATLRPLVEAFRDFLMTEASEFEATLASDTRK